MTARLLIALYPRGWRRRYAGEMQALLQDTGVGPRAVADLLAGAARAHLRPGLWVALVEPGERLRDTVETVALCWGAVVLAGAGFAKQTEDPPFQAAARAHSVLGAMRPVIAGLALAGAVVLGVCGAPLLTHALTVARRERRRDLLWRLALVPGAVAGFALVTALLLRKHPGPAAPGLALAWLTLGVAAGMLCAWAPRLVLNRLEVPDARLRRAARGAAVLAGLMAAIALSILLYGAALVAVEPRVAAGGGGPLWASTTEALFFSSVLSLGAAAAAAVSARRGYRIARG